MPTYDYVCDACGHEFELFQQMSAPVKRTCPECRERKLRRLVGTGAGVIFKGSGFYETDYRSSSYKKSAEAEKKAAAGGDGAKSEKGSKDTAKDSTAKGSSTDAAKKTDGGGASSKGSAKDSS